MTQAVLFDLDGTLVDTAPDLGYALNLQRARHGLEALPDAVIRPYASHGSRGLLGIGFGLTPQDADFDSKRTEYLDIYEQVFTRQPTLFDGVADLLKSLDERGIPWGIVTNKPRRFTQPMMQAIGLAQRAAAIVSGDDAPQPKPSPATLLLACEQIAMPPQDCIYIGDAERDIQAGKAAGMRTAVALFGYIDVTDKPEAWGADAMIDAPQDILGLL
jgi:phosphoglycolate phosphatase